MTLILTLAGWSGAALLLLAYGLASSGRVDVSSATYQALNLAGAAGLALNAVAHLAWPAAVLNTLWVAVGLATLTRLSVDVRARRRVAAAAWCGHDSAPAQPETSEPQPRSRERSRAGRGARGRRTGRASAGSRMGAQLRRTRPATRAQGDRRVFRLPRGSSRVQ